MSENEDIIDFFEGIEQRISRTKIGLEDEKLDKRIRLSDSDEGARTNARIEAMRNKQEFDESQTPEKELSEADDKIIDELIDREINRILNGDY